MKSIIAAASLFIFGTLNAVDTPGWEKIPLDNLLLDDLHDPCLPEIHQAILCNNIDFLYTHQNVAAAINERTKCGFTPLHTACLLRNTNFIQDLIKTSDINAQSNHHLTPLHIAALHGNDNAAKQLLNAGADATKTDIIGRTPLHLAAAFGHCTIVDLLINKGSNSNNALDHEGKTPYDRACQNQHDAIVAKLLPPDSPIAPSTRLSGPPHKLSNYHSDIEYISNHLPWQDEKQCTNDPANGELDEILSKAATASFEDVVQSTEEIIEHSMSKDIKYSEWTMLHFAVLRNTLDFIELTFTSQSPELNMKNASGNTPLHIASLTNNYTAATILIKLGASLLEENNARKTAYDIAIEKNYHNIARLLFEATNDITREHLEIHNKTTVQNPQLALTRSLIMQRLDFAIRAIKEGADQSTKDEEYGNTALHLAILFENITAIRFLIKQPNAPYSCKNNAGKTPIDLAFASEKVNIIYEVVASRLVQCYHPKINIKNFATEVDRTDIEHSGCNHTEIDPDGAQQSLEMALRMHNLQLICKAIYAGANPNTQNHRGTTPLHFAVMHNATELARYLLRNGANKLVRNRFGLTAANLITGKTDPQIISLLLD